LGQGKKIILAQKGKYVSSDSNGFSRNIYKWSSSYLVKQSNCRPHFNINTCQKKTGNQLVAKYKLYRTSMMNQLMCPPSETTAAFDKYVDSSLY
jgi:hypothetical protein